MVEPHHKTENYDDEPIKSCPATEAGPELYQYPTDLVYHDILLYLEVYDCKANVFGAPVLINVLPALTFFKMADTIESRSSWTS